MTPRESYMKLRPWARKLVDIRLVWVVYAHFVVLLMLASLFTIAAAIFSSVFETVKWIPSLAAGTWQDLRAAAKYRKEGGAK